MARAGSSRSATSMSSSATGSETDVARASRTAATSQASVTRLRALLARGPGPHDETRTRDVDTVNINAELVMRARAGEVAVLVAEADRTLAPLLAEATTRQRQLDALLELALARAAAALTTAGLAERVALLKGSVTARTVYPTTAHRLRRDLDLLVSGTRDVDIVNIRATLLRAGFVDDVEPARAVRGPHGVRAWPMVLRPFAGGLALSIDLHRQLVETPWCRPDSDAILAEAAPAWDPRTAPLPLTSPRDTLIHTAIHLAENGFCLPLKAWVDVLRLVPTTAPDALATRARAQGAQAATYAAIHVAGRWFAQDFGAHLAALAPPAPQRLLLEAALAGHGAHPHRLALGPARRFFRTLVAGDRQAFVAAARAALRPPKR